LKGMA